MDRKDTAAKQKTVFRCLSSPPVTMVASLLLAFLVALGSAEACQAFDVVSEFKVECYGQDTSFGHSGSRNSGESFCIRLKVIVAAYLAQHGPFKHIKTSYQTNDLENTTPQPTTTKQPMRPMVAMARVIPARALPTAAGGFHLPNCEVTYNRTTCALCNDGYVKQYTRFGRRTLCESQCALGYTAYNDQLGARACRPRTDTGGCMSSWCLRCHHGYARLRKDRQRYCVRSCPSGYRLSHLHMQCIQTA